jgi:hypothetical protein
VIAFTGAITDPAALWLKLIAALLLVAHAIEFLVFEKAMVHLSHF